MESYFEEYPYISYPFCLTGDLSILVSALLCVWIDVAAKIRPPTAKICFLSPSVWHALCRFWKKKFCPQWNRMFGNTSIIFFDLSLSQFVHMPTRIVSSQKGFRNGIVFTKTKRRVNENIVFDTKLFFKYQLAVGVWPTWRGRRHCYNHCLIRAAFLEWGCFPVPVNE